MIVVTGATGQLGSGVVDQLLKRVPAARLGVTARDPAKAAPLAERGVTVRRADFGDPQGLAAALAGAGQVLVVSVNQLGDVAVRMHRAAIEAARAAGAGRVLYTSHMGARAGSPFAPADNHAATEAILAGGGGGGAFTALRHGFYMESMWLMAGQGLQAGELRTPEDGPVSWTARADLAEADAVLLVEAGRLDGVTPPLTAAAAVTMADLAAVASELTGRRVRHVTVTDAEWVDAKTAQGIPAPMAELLLGSFKASRRGDFAAVDPTLGEVLGRPTQSVRAFLAAKLTPA